MPAAFAASLTDTSPPMVRVEACVGAFLAAAVRANIASKSRGLDVGGLAVPRIHVSEIIWEYVFICGARRDRVCMYMCVSDR